MCNSKSLIMITNDEILFIVNKIYRFNIDLTQDEIDNLRYIILSYKIVNPDVIEFLNQRNYKI